MENKSKVRVLVIDDEAAFLDNVVDYLAYEGPTNHGQDFEVRGVLSPADAETVVVEQGFEPHVIILDNDFADIGLGENEGIDRVLPKIHVWQAQTGRDCPPRVIVVSGRFDGRDLDGLRRAAYSWSADAVEPKAGLMEQDRLIPLINKLLGPLP